MYENSYTWTRLERKHLNRRKNEKNENKNKQALIADPAKTHGPITEIYVL